MAIGKLICGCEDWLVLKQRGRRIEERRYFLKVSCTKYTKISEHKKRNKGIKYMKLLGFEGP
jgi:hypothetical protein